MSKLLGLLLLTTFITLNQNLVFVNETIVWNSIATSQYPYNDAYMYTVCDIYYV